MTWWSALLLLAIGVVVNLVAIVVDIMFWAGWISIAFIMLHSITIGACLWTYYRLKKK